MKMNHIIIRTSKGEYFGGETVYGVVYLNIRSPTAGNGVALSLKGSETYSYQDVCSFSDAESKQVYGGSHDYVDCENIKLYECKGGTLPFGQYMFPFSYPLPKDIPGSFCLSGNKFSKWSGRVEHHVTAHVLGADTLKSHQHLVINQAIPNLNNVNDPNPVRETLQVKKLLGMVTKELTVTISLNKSAYISGETAVLHLEIENETGKNIHCISIKVVQELFLRLKKPKTSSDNSGSSDSSGHHSRSDSHDPLCVQPNGCDTTLWHKCLTGREEISRWVAGGISKIFIPLKSEGANSHSVESTCLGKHIHCTYCILVDVSLEKEMKQLNLIVPIHCIYPPKNTEWHTWTPPDWISKCQLKLTDGVCSVSPDILETDVFTGLPGFMVL